jgi:GntR family transcriptional repressor for pyruvate dehydrogenase complex
VRTLGRAAPLADQVFGALQSDIAEGRLKPLEKLPIEQQLAASFGVSRTVVREAVARLRSDGLVTVKQGSGVFVAAGPFNRAFRMPAEAASEQAAIREIYELRLGVEVEAAALAAARMVPDNLMRIKAALGMIEATKSGPDFGVQADADFHRAIALATGNSKIASFQRYLSVFLVQSITAARANTRQSLPGAVDEVMGEHQAIYAAIEAEDAAGARAAMRAHLTNAQARLGLAVPDPRITQQVQRLR